MSTITFMEDREDPCPCCEMSVNTRLIGACVCSGIGMLLSVGSFIAIATGSLSTFAVIYSLGTIVAVAGSFFVASPEKHFERLKVVAHSVSLGVLVASIVMVFVGAYAIGGIGGTVFAIIFVIVQIVALALFTITLNQVAWAATKTLLGKILTCCH